MLKLFKYVLFVSIALVAILISIYIINPDFVKQTVVDLLYPTVTIKEEHQNRFTVEVPKVYELMYIACTLTETFQHDDNLVNSKTQYYDEVMKHFGKHREHPLVTLLEERLKEDPYSQLQPTIRLFSLNYELDEDNNLLEDEVFHVNPVLLWLFKSNVFLFSEHEGLIEDFAKQTGFFAFYQDHVPYYNHLIETYPRLCDFQGMWDWLEDRFPERYNSYRIIFSPLTGGFHNSIPGLKDKDIKQTWIFVSAPDENIDSLSEAAFEIASSKAARRVFTEIDHNYVNPISDNYAEQIEQAMPDYKQWNQEKQGYRGSISTFNEYMTWGVFSLYALDTYSSQQIDSIITIQNRFMVTNRGFHRFNEFNQQLIRLYNGSQSTQIENLYKPLLAWIRKFKSNKEAAELP